MSWCPHPNSEMTRSPFTDAPAATTSFIHTGRARSVTSRSRRAPTRPRLSSSAKQLFVSIRKASLFDWESHESIAGHKRFVCYTRMCLTMRMRLSLYIQYKIATTRHPASRMTGCDWPPQLLTILVDTPSRQIDEEALCIGPHITITPRQSHNLVGDGQKEDGLVVIDYSLAFVP